MNKCDVNVIHRARAAYKLLEEVFPKFDRKMCTVLKKSDRTFI